MCLGLSEKMARTFFEAFRGNYLDLQGTHNNGPGFPKDRVYSQLFWVLWRSR